MVNTHRVDEGMHTAGRSAVMNAAKRMGPIVTKIQKRIKGTRIILLGSLPALIRLFK